MVRVINPASMILAVHRLVAWYREGADVQRLLPQLATYLGHVNVAATGSCQERCRII